MKALARIFGNFGVGFASPFGGVSIGEQITNFNLSFEQIILISFVSAIFATILSASKEAIKYGESKKQK